MIRRYFDTDKTASQCEYFDSLNRRKPSIYGRNNSISDNSDNYGTSNNAYTVPLKDYYSNNGSLCFHTRDCYDMRSSGHKEKYVEAFASTLYY